SGNDLELAVLVADDLLGPGRIELRRSPPGLLLLSQPLLLGRLLLAKESLEGVGVLDVLLAVLGQLVVLLRPLVSLSQPGESSMIVVDAQVQAQLAQGLHDAHRRLSSGSRRGGQSRGSAGSRLDGAGLLRRLRRRGLSCRPGTGGLCRRLS